MSGHADLGPLAKTSRPPRRPGLSVLRVKGIKTVRKRTAAEQRLTSTDLLGSSCRGAPGGWEHGLAMPCVRKGQSRREDVQRLRRRRSPRGNSGRRRCCDSQDEHLAIGLVQFGQMTTHRTAEVLDVTHETVKSTISHGHQRLAVVT